MNLDLSNEKAAALTKKLANITGNDQEARQHHRE
jgi:hypothetical protein